MDTEQGRDERENADVAERRQRRLPPDERRGEILTAALAVFAELGYRPATLNDVADRVGVTKGCLYHYFESKEQLLVALLRERVASAVQAEEELVATAGGPGDQLLRALLERKWLHFQQPGQIELATLAINELAKVPEAGRYLYEEVVKPGRQTLCRALERGIPKGAVAGEEIERAATVVPWMILGVALGQHLLGAIDPIAGPDDKTGETVITMLLRGLAGAGAGASRPP